ARPFRSCPAGVSSTSSATTTSGRRDRDAFAHAPGPRMRAAFGDAGYLVQASVYSEAECAALRAAAEEVSARIVARAERTGAGPVGELADGHRIQFSSRTAIQWEWAAGSREIRLLEPCDHLDPMFAALFTDERLVRPVQAELG